MSRESRMLAGILLVVLPTVMFGGLPLLMFLTGNSPGYFDNLMRHDLFRGGHAHAGVYLVLSLVMLRYVDEAALSHSWKWRARVGDRGDSDPGGVLSICSVAGCEGAERVVESRIHRRGVPGCRGSDPRSRSDSRGAAEDI
jgi:hypothetical protein